MHSHAYARMNLLFEFVEHDEFHAAELDLGSKVDTKVIFPVIDKLPNLDVVDDRIASTSHFPQGSSPHGVTNLFGILCFFICY